MDLYVPRKLKFKAWNKETKLLMRLNSIDCIKGELFKKDHILLQFTGLYDKQQDEVYELDILLTGSEKIVVLWSAERHAWMYAPLKNPEGMQPLSKDALNKAVRLCNYFESEG